MTSRHTWCPLLVVLLLLIAAAPALGATAPTHSTSDRAAAREFSYAAYRLRVAVLANKPEVRRRAEALAAPDCYLDGRRILKDKNRPARARAVAVSLLITALFDVALAPQRAALETFQAELDRVPVDNATLRSGRAAWRTDLAAHRAVVPLPADICSQVKRWRESGYRYSQRPSFTPVAEEMLNDDLPPSPKLIAASRELERLGIKPFAARRFTGTPILVDVADEPAVERAIFKKFARLY